MFTVDARCDRCAHKSDCPERKIVIPKLMTIANDLNAPEFDASPADGILQFYCNGFTVG